jgi:CRISPR/Cas system endoribonuclease Cas6 (RAMP superfamily)
MALQFKRYNPFKEKYTVMSDNKFFQKMFESIQKEYNAITDTENGLREFRIEWNQYPTEDKDVEQERKDRAIEEIEYMNNCQNRINKLYQALYDMGLMSEFCNQYEILMEACLMYITDLRNKNDEDIFASFKG